jgi:hypothetical protein
MRRLQLEMNAKNSIDLAFFEFIMDVIPIQMMYCFILNCYPICLISVT